MRPGDTTGAASCDTVEIDQTPKIFSYPAEKRTKDDITSRFGWLGMRRQASNL